MKSLEKKLLEITETSKETERCLKEAEQKMKLGIKKAAAFKEWIQYEVEESKHRSIWKTPEFRKGYEYALLKVMKKMKIERKA